MTDLEEKYAAWATALIREAVPFKAKGRDRNGIDCWGVVWLGKAEIEGISLPSYLEDYTHSDIRRLDHLEKIFVREVPFWDRLNAGEEQAGDVVLMRMSGRSIHVGLVVAKGKMLHIEEKIDLCIEDYDATTWANRVTGVYRYRSR